MFQIAKQTALPKIPKNSQLKSTFGSVNSGVRFGMPSVKNISGIEVTNAQNITRRVTKKPSIVSVYFLMRIE